MQLFWKSFWNLSFSAHMIFVFIFWDKIRDQHKKMNLEKCHVSVYNSGTKLRGTGVQPPVSLASPPVILRSAKREKGPHYRFADLPSAFELWVCAWNNSLTSQENTSKYGRSLLLLGPISQKHRTLISVSRNHILVAYRSFSTNTQPFQLSLYFLDRAGYRLQNL